MFFSSSNPSFAKNPKVKVDSESRSYIPVAWGGTSWEQDRCLDTWIPEKSLQQEGELSYFYWKDSVDCFILHYIVKGNLPLPFDALEYRTQSYKCALLRYRRPDPRRTWSAVSTCSGFRAPVCVCLFWPPISLALLLWSSQLADSALSWWSESRLPSFFLYVRS